MMKIITTTITMAMIKRKKMTVMINFINTSNAVWLSKHLIRLLQRMISKQQYMPHRVKKTRPSKKNNNNNKKKKMILQSIPSVPSVDVPCVTLSLHRQSTVHYTQAV